MDAKAKQRKASRVLYRTAPMAIEKMANKMTPADRDEFGRHLEAIAEKAAFMATYLVERAYHGHRLATKEANRSARILWTKGFCYNGHWSRKI